MAVDTMIKAVRTYVVNVDGREYAVSRKKVKNLTLRIKNAAAYVTAPLSVSEERIITFIKVHSDWTEKHVKKAEKRESKVFLFGKEYVRLDVEWHRAYAVFGEDGVCTVYGKDEKARERALADRYKKAIAPVLPPLFEKWQKATGLKAGKIEITSAKSYLGRCRVNDARIRISCRLAAKSESVIDYVVLHEICHLRYANHQKNFYALVARYMPDYKARIKLMKGR